MPPSSIPPESTPSPFSSPPPKSNSTKPSESVDTLMKGCTSDMDVHVWKLPLELLEMREGMEEGGLGDSLSGEALEKNWMPEIGWELMSSLRMMDWDKG